MRTAVDVVVIGGGVAGCATAISLARAGVPTVVLQRPKRAGWRVGETLPPAARPELEALGLWDRFVADGHVASAGNRSAWGGPEPADRDFIFDPHGPGWHVDRARFDAMMADGAVATGAEWRACARPVGAPVRLAGGWHVEAAPVALRARFVVDATGRSSRVARRQGAHRRVVDRMIGIAALVPGEPDDPRTLVEAVATGWWYSAGVPGGTVVAHMTDPDQVDARQASTPAGFAALLAGATHTAGRVDPGAVVRPQVVPAGSSLLVPAAGPGWLAVGDAAATCDPLASQGILVALASGRAAARAVVAALAGETAAGRRYAADVVTGYARYLALRAGYYAVERRWPGSPFWQRRLGAASRRSRPSRTGTLAGVTQGGSS